MAWRRSARGSVIALALAGGLAFGAVSSPASALSCAEGGLSVRETLDNVVALGGTAFVGTVVSTTNDGTWATFAVDEVWAGEVPDEVEVKGDYRHGAGEFQIVSYAAPSFEPGQQYLLFPSLVREPFQPFYGSADGEYELSPCSDPPPVFSEGLAAYRPADARIVERSEPVEIIGVVPMTEDEPPWVLIGAGAAVVVAGVVGLVALRRRRRTAEVEVDEVYL